MKTIRVFISSPGDVAVERDKARKVVEARQKPRSWKRRPTRSRRWAMLEEME